MDVADKIFWTSDTHFGHNSAVTKGWRPMFSTVEEMDAVLVQNWNSVVPKDGLVFHLGDFSFRNNRRTHEILDQLHGRIALVKGNHDDNLSKSVRDRFLWVKDYYRAKMESYIPGDETRIVMSHYAMRVWNGYHRGAWMLYGHSHASLPPLGMSMDVGVDNNGMRPISYRTLQLEMSRLALGVDEEAFDYHIKHAKEKERAREQNHRSV